jgi:hypothetical protein
MSAAARAGATSARRSVNGIVPQGQRSCGRRLCHEQQMAVFDALPSAARAFVNDCPFGVCVCALARDIGCEGLHIAMERWRRLVAEALS